VDQAVKEHVDLERVVSGCQPRHESPQAIEVSFVLVQFVAPVGVVVRPQLGEVGVDEGLLIQQIRLQSQAVVQLLLQQLLVNRHRTERLAVAMIQVVDDQLREVRMIGTLQSLEQVPAAIGVQFRGGEPIERRVLVAVEILVALLGELRQPLAADECLIEFGWSGSASRRSLSR